MDDAELEALFADIESDRVERKERWTHAEKLSEGRGEKKKDNVRDRVCQAICAFGNNLSGNGKSGVVIIGQRDDGGCAGLTVSDGLLKSLAECRESILPFPSMVVEKRVVRGCEIAVAVVRPSDTPPLRYEGNVWIRVGPRRAIASPEDERILNERRRWRNLPFDIRPVEGAKLEDLDLAFFRSTYLPEAVAPEVLAANGRSIEEQLASVRFIVASDDPQPTVCGMLAVGLTPRDHLPGAYIQFLRINGGKLSDPIVTERAASGPLSQLLTRIDDAVGANISTAVDIMSASAEIRRPDYPLEALRQLIRNAVMHRNYEGTNAPIRVTWFDDRIEINSPGGPFGRVGVENFGRPGVTDYRNPHLAEVMKNLGFVQKFGVGIDTAREALRANGNPEPEFQVDAGGVNVIVRRRS